MNKITEKLLLEIISFLNTRKFKKGDIYLKKAYNELGDKILKIRTEDLLNWIDPRDHFSFTNLDKYVIYEDFMTQETIEEITQEFTLLFKYIPELNEVFVFKDRAIRFNSSLSQADIKKIYDFVKTNYIIHPSRISRYISPTKE